jgi:hypothetical protein
MVGNKYIFEQTVAIVGLTRARPRLVEAGLATKNPPAPRFNSRIKESSVLKIMVTFALRYKTGAA